MHVTNHPELNALDPCLAFLLFELGTIIAQSMGTSSPPPDFKPLHSFRLETFHIPLTLAPKPRGRSPLGGGNGRWRLTKKENELRRTRAHGTP